MYRLSADEKLMRMVIVVLVVEWIGWLRCGFLNYLSVRPRCILRSACDRCEVFYKR